MEGALRLRRRAPSRILGSEFRFGAPAGGRGRAAKVGDSREKLGEPHLRIFREQYGDLVTSLGYEVR